MCMCVCVVILSLLCLVGLCFFPAWRGGGDGLCADVECGFFAA